MRKERTLGAISAIASPIAYLVYFLFQGFGWRSFLFHLTVFVFGIAFWRWGR